MTMQETDYYHVLDKCYGIYSSVDKILSDGVEGPDWYLYMSWFSIKKVVYVFKCYSFFYNLHTLHTNATDL